MGRPVRKVLVVSGCLVALAFLAWVGYRLNEARRIAKASRELSKMMSVRQTLVVALEEFYQTNRAYPATLANLPAGLLHWGEEGSSPADLASWDYSSSGNGFQMSWRRGSNHFLVTTGWVGVIPHDQH